MVSRSAYTLLDAIGDFGGFNDAIYFLLSIPMGYYTSAAFSKHVTSLFYKESDTENTHRNHIDKYGHKEDRVDV